MKPILVIILLTALLYQTHIMSVAITPVMMAVKTTETLRLAAIKAGLPDPGERIAKAVSISATQTGISKELILALMHSESGFQPKAISSKNYRGLMQIPARLESLTANTLEGSHILANKLIQTKGNLTLALILYKGWPITSQRGKQEAQKVLSLTRKLKEVI